MKQEEICDYQKLFNLKLSTHNKYTDTTTTTTTTTTTAAAAATTTTTQHTGYREC